MGIWQQLTGKKTHCAGCGITLPITPENKFEEVYCSETCRRNVLRISSVPPPPSEEDVSELREIPFTRWQ